MRRILRRKLENDFISRIAPMMPGERSEMKIASLPHDAAGGWHYDSHAKRHTLLIDDGFTRYNTRGGSNLSFGRAVMRHEACHAKYSERDGSKLLSVGAPYLANLFEDARIEQKARREQRRQFGWKNYCEYAVERGHHDAASIFQDLITSEGSNKEMKKIKEACAMGGAEKTFDRAMRYFNKARGAASTMDLQPLVEKWTKEFGVTPSPAPFTPHAGSATAAAAGVASAGMGGAHAPAPAPPATGGGGSAHYVDPTRVHAHGTHFSHAAPSKSGAPWKDKPDNRAKANKCVARLMDAFKVGVNTRYTQSPKGRLSLRHVIQSLPSIFRGHVKTGSNEPMNIRAIIDTSGSMFTTMERELGAFVEALLVMHEKGMMKLDLWLSGDGRYTHIDNPRRGDAHHIMAAGGSESIHTTMKASDKWKPAKEYDAVLIITDGQITDGSVERKHFSGQDNTFCCYVPDTVPMNEHIFNRMKDQFPHAICRNTAESLATHVAGALASRRASGQFAQH